MTTPAIYTTTQAVLLGGDRFTVAEGKDGYIHVTAEDGRMRLLLTMDRSSAARLLADLSAVVTLSEMAGVEKEVV